MNRSFWTMHRRCWHLAILWAISVIWPAQWAPLNGQDAIFPLQPVGSVTYTPAQIRSAYGTDRVPFSGGDADGSGQTIAIVGAYDYPNALGTLNYFSNYFNLPQFNTGYGPTFTQLNQSGGTASYPGVDPAHTTKLNNWENEVATDIEWVHAIAPKASIVLVESNDSSNTGLFAAANTARNLPGVSVVSMSWGFNDSASWQAMNSQIFVTPGTKSQNRQGVTFVAATLDKGSASTYPATSPNVVSVGGTTLTLTASNTYASETAWPLSNGGTSSVEPLPPYQSTIASQQGFSTRATPDVSFVADPSTGVYVYDAFNGGWFAVGGTSVGAPAWAGMFALANQIRTGLGYGTLDGVTDTLPGLYSLPPGDFHDITTGANNGYAAGVGYDPVTGLGTPVAPLLVPHLAMYGVPEPLAIALFATAILAIITCRRRR